MGASYCHGHQLCGLGNPAGTQEEMHPGSAGRAYNTSGTPSTAAPDGADSVPRSASDALRRRGSNRETAVSSLKEPRSPQDAVTTVAVDKDQQVLSLAASYFQKEAAELEQSQPVGTNSAVRRREQRIFKSGAIYDGEWKGNVRDGLGTQTWPDGARFQGEWRDNEATGKGQFKHSDGDIYCGEWRHNLAHGRGTYRHRNGTIYTGEFVDDLQDGLGRESWPDSSTYSGYFRKGKKSGVGLYEWPDGSKYQGQWRENQIDGAGYYTGSDKRSFEGYWAGSTMHGCGRYVWAGDCCFAGQYVWDLKDGFGVFTWADGRKYEGYWARGRQHGSGRLCTASGTTRLAEWDGGKQVRWLEEEESSEAASRTSYQEGSAQI